MPAQGLTLGFAHPIGLLIFNTYKEYSICRLVYQGNSNALWEQN
jgi:hypothetical protein